MHYVENPRVLYISKAFQTIFGIRTTTETVETVNVEVSFAPVSALSLHDLFGSRHMSCNSLL